MKKQKQLVLALGEGSHTHVLTAPSIKNIDINAAAQQVSFSLTSEGVITHEEHDRIVLPPGEYEKEPQYEYDSFAGHTRFVYD